MNEVKVNGIVLRAIDYKEKDKLITLFSVELGIISCVLKGVNNKNAKLKFASLPFCFAEFVLAEKNGFFTVTECSQIESFYTIVSDYQKSLVGFFMLEVTSIIMHNSTPDEQWFVTLLTYLKNLAYGNADSNVIAIKFILHTLAKSGYELDLKMCDTCGLSFMGDVYLDFDTGELKCETCFSSNSIKFTKQEFGILKIINNCSLEKLNTIKASSSTTESLIASLKSNLELRLNHKLKSLLF